MANFIEATKWLSDGQAIELKNGTFEKCTVKEKLQRFFYSDHENEQILKITSFVQDKLPKAKGEERQQYLQFAAALIKHEPDHKIIRIFDREIVKYRPQVVFEQTENQAALQKWLRNGLPPAIYQKHSDFCRFLESSGLLSQMKVTRDTVKEIDGEPALIVQGKWMKWPDLKDQFEAVYSKRYRETFIVHKQTYEVYTYLDNGRGLQPHHPYLTEQNPTS